MRTTPSPVPWKTLGLAALALVVLGGCTVKPRPPVYSLYGHKGLVLVPFVNKTGDSGLVGDFQPVFTQRLSVLNAVPLFEAEQVGGFLRSQGRGPTQVDNDSDFLKALGAKFKADLVMTGTLDSYEEIVTDSKPQRVVLNSQTGEAQWGYYTYKKVTVHASAKIKDPATGALLWSNGSSAYSYDNHWNVLPIPGAIVVPREMDGLESAYRLMRRKLHRDQDDAPPPATPEAPTKPRYADDPQLNQLRANAISLAARYLSDDFRGRGAWTPGLQTN